jgi:hypothetical protein
MEPLLAARPQHTVQVSHLDIPITVLLMIMAIHSWQLTGQDVYSLKSFFR